jgi:sigma-B regulation protein RsbU (phosphoserine phosphatase)
MAKIAGIKGESLRIPALLLAVALIPMAVVGVVSLMEMDHASKDVQDKISGLSTTLNRSALTVASNEADQVQLAIAKAHQYDNFFKHLKVENEMVANYVAANRESESSSPPAGIWIAPLSSNETTPEMRDATVNALGVPAKILQSIMISEPAISLCYIGTEDGVLITWPYNNETLSNTAPFDYRDRPYYAAARDEKKTIWTGPYLEGVGLPAITCTTPIYRGEKFFGVAVMEVSLESLYSDLSAVGGRGYPFIMDRSGSIIMRPKSRPTGVMSGLFASDNLSERNSSEIRNLIQKMNHGKAGSSVVGLENGDGYVAFAPMPTAGWSLGIAYPAEEMSLPARFIDAGVKEAAKGATQGLSDAAQRAKELTVLIFATVGLTALIAGALLNRRINGQISSITAAADRIANGEFDADVEVEASGKLAPLGRAFTRMSRNLKNHMAKLEGDAEERGELGKEAAVLREVKRSLVPGYLPQAEGYEIAALYLPSKINGFDFYDLLEADDKIAFIMADADGEGVQAAMLAIMSRALIRARSRKSDPSKAMEELNSQISAHAQGAHLACFYALLDTADHTLEYANAGFNPPFIVDPGGMVDTLGGGGIALGMLNKMDLQSERIPLQQGDVLVMYSDGVTEAKNSRSKPFGTERLITTVRNNRTLSAEEILKAVEEDFRAFSKDSALLADYLLVILKRS